MASSFNRGCHLRELRRDSQPRSKPLRDSRLPRIDQQISCVTKINLVLFHLTLQKDNCVLTSLVSSSCLLLVSHVVLHSVAKHTNRQQQQTMYHPVHSALTFEATRGSPLS